MKIEVRSLPGCKYKYVIQTPDDLQPGKHLLVFGFHGSRSLEYDAIVDEMEDEYKRGRWRFYDDFTRKTCIFVTPVIPDREGDARTSNNLSVNAQSFFRGCVDKRCEEEFPELYAPQLEIEKIIRHLQSEFSSHLITPKALLVGLSAGGSFATRFTFLYPELVAGVISMLSTDLVIPLEEYKGLELYFPFGIADLEDCPTVKIRPEVFPEYFKIPKLIVKDNQDDRRGKRSSLYWEINPQFYEEYSKIFGEESFERAYNRSKFLNEEFNDNIEVVITAGQGHHIPDEDFDAHIQRYVRKVIPEWWNL